MTELNMTVDPIRVDFGETGIYVRATLHGEWGSYDIATLDRPSLQRFLTCRGGSNEWAEGVAVSGAG
ncbi:MAG: hypothetical protein ACRDTJ_17305 [Pseudonocardiaceae bacterium]